MFVRSRGSERVTDTLNALRAAVMLADENLVITHVNESALDLLRQAEAELRQELPNFSADKLVGSNIDVFHKSPQHQRAMLAKLDKPHFAAIAIGKRTFDLKVTPLMSGVRRSGFVVEWADSNERLMAYGLQVAAIERTFAVAHFDPQGGILDANAVLLKAMGYAREEVIGNQHRMFVEPAMHGSAEYRQLWSDLREGRTVAGQFRRVGKGGRKIWIEAVYLPLPGHDGRTSRVVKFAIDMTAQKTLLNDLKGLIDTNFTEIDGTIDLTTSESNAAQAGSHETLNNVQAVVSAAGQLTASISEISRSMAASRGAADDAYEQALMVGENTRALVDATHAMNGIVALIRDVASQINLLALNATIEAARAGEAGKGFAVVAAEVKNLSRQASSATERITTEIEAIQSTSSRVAEALGSIQGAVTTVRESVAVTAAAVEEQSAVTSSMSANMAGASTAVEAISHNIGEIAAAVAQAKSAVARTRQAAEVLVE